MQKFRLDWNYHSNNLEGNSLTYGETKALILFGITAQGKPLKDHFEVTGHDEAIKWIEDVVKDETPLTEKFIRELHTLILKESSYKKAKAPDGKPTRRKIEVGKYKTQPNHVVTITGETFYFATPEETPAKMQELVEWFRKEKEKSKVNPILLASLFHYRFIRIHPFDDGNGRVARILMNFILMSFGYPPVIIKTEDKENYYAVLRLADADEIEPFIEYIAQNLVHSLELMIKGAKGEEIEEPDDLDKELFLLEKRLERFEKKILKKRTINSVMEVFDEVFPNIYFRFIKSSEKFNKFYRRVELIINTDYSKYKLEENFENIDLEKIKEIYSLKSKSSFNHFPHTSICYKYIDFNRAEVGNFNYISKVFFLFYETNYVVGDFISTPNKLTFRKEYSQTLSEEEINKIISHKAKQHQSFIEKQIKLTK